MKRERRPFRLDFGSVSNAWVWDSEGNLSTSPRTVTLGKDRSNLVATLSISSLDIFSENKILRIKWELVELRLKYTHNNSNYDFDVS